MVKNFSGILASMLFFFRFYIDTFGKLQYIIGKRKVLLPNITFPSCAGQLAERKVSSFRSIPVIFEGLKKMSKELGKRIQEQMNGLRLSQKQLAELANVTEVSMSRYISGDRDPSTETLANIATALHTTTDYLLGKEQEQDFNFRHVKTLLARNAGSLDNKQKREIINALFGD